MELLQKDNNSIFLIFIFLAIALLPFNDLPYFSFFGEMSGEGAFYPFLIGIFIWIVFLFRGQKVIIPQDPVFLLLGLFFLWILISGAVNFSSITTNLIKGRTGIEKYLLQVMVLSFCFGVTLFIYNFLLPINNYLGVIRLFVFVSLIIAGVYSVVEIAHLIGCDFANNVLEFIDPYIRKCGLYERLRSVSGEASWFAMYCSFILPWIVSYIFTEKRRTIYIIIVSYLLVMVILTASRTAYYITIAQLGILFLVLLFIKADLLEKKKLYFLALAVLTGLTVGVYIDNLYTAADVKDVIISFTSNDSRYAQSNNSRLGSQTTAINLGKDHPVFGAGIGQYGFYIADYVP